METQQMMVQSGHVTTEGDPFTEQYRHEVNLYFVDQSRSYELLCGICAAHHGDIIAINS
jgi:hypothetical protein